MTENEINITDMIKALQCIASQDADGDCYCDHFNAHLTCEQFGDNARLDEKHMSCGGILKNTQSCPYSQKTYGVCYKDGELWWLEDIVSILEEIQQYRAIGTIEEFKALKEHMKIIQEAYENTDGYKDGYAKAINEFSERLKERIVGMQMAELQGEDICPCAENGKECPYTNQDIGCQYCAREHTIKEIDEIAEEMRGAE